MVAGEKQAHLTILKQLHMCHLHVQDELLFVLFIVRMLASIAMGMAWGVAPIVGAYGFLGCVHGCVYIHSVLRVHTFSTACTYIQYCVYIHSALSTLRTSIPAPGPMIVHFCTAHRVYRAP